MIDIAFQNDGLKIVCMNRNRVDVLGVKGGLTFGHRSMCDFNSNRIGL
jgi:hypothetical protein